MSATTDISQNRYNIVLFQRLIQGFLASVPDFVRRHGHFPKRLQLAGISEAYQSLF
jgi:hypothetical protein